MGLFEHFPYSNFHELNLDWIISEIKKLRDDVDALQKKIDGLKEEILNEVDQKIADAKTEILNQLEIEINNLREELTQLIDTKIQDAVNSINQQIEQINSTIEQLRQDFEKCCDEVKKDIGDLQASISTINQTITEIQNTLVGINNRVSTVETKVASIENRLDDDEASIDSILTSISSINTAIGDITSHISNINNTITNIQADITNITTELNSVKQTVDGHTTEIGSLDDRVTALEDAGGGGGEPTYNLTYQTSNTKSLADWKKENHVVAFNLEVNTVGYNFDANDMAGCKRIFGSTGTASISFGNAYRIPCGMTINNVIITHMPYAYACDFRSVTFNLDSQGYAAGCVFLNCSWEVNNTNLSTYNCHLSGEHSITLRQVESCVFDLSGTAGLTCLGMHNSSVDFDNGIVSVDFSCDGSSITGLKSNSTFIMPRNCYGNDIAVYNVSCAKSNASVQNTRITATNFTWTESTSNAAYFANCNINVTAINGSATGTYINNSTIYSGINGFANVTNCVTP